MDKTQHNRKIYIDIIKIIAIFFVIFNHTLEEGYFHFLYQPNHIKKAIELLISCFIKINTSLFFMASGALLLGRKKESLLLKHRIFKYIMIIIIFTLAWYLFNGGNDFAWIMKTMYSSTTFSYCGAYWFLYSYVAFLFILPFLIILAKNLTKDLFVYLVALNIIFCSILPITESIFNLKSIAISIPIVNSIIFYPLVGYYLDQNMNNTITNKKMWSIAIVGLLALMFNFIICVIKLKQGTFSENHLTLFTNVLTITVFILVYAIYKRIKLSDKIEHIITKISSCSFGIYLIHGFVFALLNERITTYSYSLGMLKALCVYFISLILIMIMKEIPLIKKLI